MGSVIDPIFIMAGLTKNFSAYGSIDFTSSLILTSMNFDDHVDLKHMLTKDVRDPDSFLDSDMYDDMITEMQSIVN